MSILNIKINNISVIGLGKLGLPLATCFATRSFKVTGVDINETIVRSINISKAPFFEPGLEKAINKSSVNLSATTSHAQAIKETDISIILVATPSKNGGNFSNKYIKAAITSLSNSLRHNSKPYHLFIISSTVMPESINRRLIPIIEKRSLRKLNNGFGITYVPDFVKLGEVINDFFNPDFVLIGESDQVAGNITEKIYSKMIMNKAPIKRTSIINAELAKIALNCFLTTKISFGNMVGNLAEKISGADSDVITNIIGSDKRIGPKFLKGALAFGGPCFPRDTRAFISLSKKYNYNPYLVKSVDKTNKYQNIHLSQTVIGKLKNYSQRKISILGLSFKPATTIIEESPSIELIQNLLKNNIEVSVYDPLAIENTKLIFGNKINYCASAKVCLNNSKVLIIMTPDDNFRGIEKDIKANTLCIIDCWGILKGTKLPKRTEHYVLGKNSIS